MKCVGARSPCTGAGSTSTDAPANAVTQAPGSVKIRVHGHDLVTDRCGRMSLAVNGQAAALKRVEAEPLICGVPASRESS